MNSRLPFKRLIIPLVLAIFLSACNYPMPTSETPTALPTDTPTPAPTATTAPTQVEAQPSQVAQGDPCLSGRWEIQDFTAYVNSVIPSAAIQQGSLTVKSSSGSLRYTFGADGKITVSATEFTMDTDVTIGSLTLPLTLTLSGSGTVDYAADPQTGVLRLANPADKDLTVSASLANSSILSQVPVGSLVWFGSTDAGAAQVSYTCSANTVEIIPIPGESGAAGKAIPLVRVTP